MGHDNPILLLTARDQLADVLMEHLALPVPYRLTRYRKHAAMDSRMILLDTATSQLPKGLDIPFITVGSPHEGAVRHFAFPLRIPALGEALSQLLPQIKTDPAPIPVGQHVLYHPQEKELSTPLDKRFPLTQKESELLLCLLEANGGEVGRDRLLAEVWGYDESAASHTLETHLYRLRQKLAAAEASDVQIAARRGGLALVVG